MALAPRLAFVQPPEVPRFRVGFAACVDPLSPSKRSISVPSEWGLGASSIYANEKGDNRLPAGLETEVFDVPSVSAVGGAGYRRPGAPSATGAARHERSA